ncbi:acyltransferase [Pseudoalteromonas sp. C2R02]|uniref:MBOAT family O-acyltransferase n=1 Tax=Pseudoalteromonas sp. C2R02 TaxID=2841565 RepID=UPI001C085C93|nr:MBOAT family O-acyltransferase [Pseudoalteromonas sp. C2R02]MBU2970865.1 acyltransferase [Pseudoalteromonas sp. C2R02]
MKRKLSLSQYVKRRNGVPLGSSGSLFNMLQRSLGAGSFSEFWRYWNPIWGYYLGRFIFSPLKSLFPTSIALVFTFTFSGFLHDLIVSLIKREMELVITPWFLLIGISIVITEYFSFKYIQLNFYGCAIINISFLTGTFILSTHLY